MSRPVRFSVTSPVTVEQIFSAFTQEEYWLARLAHFGGSNSLDALLVDDDGTVRVGTVQRLDHHSVPRVIATVLPSDSMIVRCETWKRRDDGRVSGTISMAAEGVPGSGGGTALVEPAGRGAQLTVAATVQFQMPLIGGTIERLIAGDLAEGVRQIQGFTTRWIVQHSTPRDRLGIVK